MCGCLHPLQGVSVTLYLVMAAAQGVQKGPGTRGHPRAGWQRDDSPRGIVWTPVSTHKSRAQRTELGAVLYQQPMGQAWILCYITFQNPNAHNKIKALLPGVCLLQRILLLGEKRHRMEALLEGTQ